VSWFYTPRALNGEELGRGETDCFSAQSTILGIAMRLNAARRERRRGREQDIAYVTQGLRCHRLAKSTLTISMWHVLPTTRRALPRAS
jgi:hypothetical protein